MFNTVEEEKNIYVAFCQLPQLKPLMCKKMKLSICKNYFNYTYNMYLRKDDMLDLLRFS